MFERILVSVDRSEDSERALKMAGELAAKFRSALFVVHARDVPMALPMTAGARPPRLTFAIESEDEARQLVDDAVSKLEASGALVSGEVLGGSGSVASQILETAKVRHVDLIVLGSRGMSTIEQLMLGGVAHKVVNLASCPVLLAR
jgi:nucleotide-binding universal stress UspA family protein